MNKACFFIYIGLCLSVMAVQAETFTDGIGDISASSISSPVAKTGLKAPEIYPAQVNLPATYIPAKPNTINSADTDIPMAYEFGYVQAVSPNLLDGIPWQAIPEGKVFKVELHSPFAKGLRLKFNNWKKNANLELRVYSTDGVRVFGPIINPPLDENGDWWSPTIFGETIGVEFYAPGVSEPDLPMLADSAHVYCTDPFECLSGPGTAMTCHNDISCYSSWKTADGRAVALMGFISGSSCFSCTGALLNRIPADFSPLFMTANHCISTQSEAGSLELFWAYETASCGGTVPSFNSLDRNNGSQLLKRYSDADWSLLGLWERPVGNYYLGWSSGSWSPGGTATGVHHPRSTYKRISFGEIFGNMRQTFCDSGGANCFEAEVWNIDYDDGLTEPGSSGSPVFDSNRRVRGTLTGGPAASCSNSSNISRYGRLDLAYTNVRYFIDNPATPCYVNRTYAGDSGNNGNSERGTIINPFNRVYEATFAVRADDSIYISAGNYNESFTVRRPMTLRAFGGTVNIGKP